MLGRPWPICYFTTRKETNKTTSKISLFLLSSEGNSARDGCLAGSNGITLKLRADNFFFGSSDIRARFAWRLLIWYNAELSMTEDWRSRISEFKQLVFVLIIRLVLSVVELWIMNLDHNYCLHTGSLFECVYAGHRSLERSSEARWLKIGILYVLFTQMNMLGYSWNGFVVKLSLDFD